MKAIEHYQFGRLNENQKLNEIFVLINQCIDNDYYFNDEILTKVLDTLFLGYEGTYKSVQTIHIDCSIGTILIIVPKDVIPDSINPDKINMLRALFILNDNNQWAFRNGSYLHQPSSKEYSKFVLWMLQKGIYAIHEHDIYRRQEIQDEIINSIHRNL